MPKKAMEILLSPGSGASDLDAPDQFEARQTQDLLDDVDYRGHALFLVDVPHSLICGLIPVAFGVVSVRHA